jgi:hypothetical protein
VNTDVVTVFWISVVSAGCGSKKLSNKGENIMGAIEDMDAFIARRTKIESLVMQIQKDIFVKLETRIQIIYDTLINDVAETYRVKPREAVKIVDAVLDNCETLQYDGTTIKIRK